MSRALLAVVLALKVAAQECVVQIAICIDILGAAGATTALAGLIAGAPYALTGTSPPPQPDHGSNPGESPTAPSPDTGDRKRTPDIVYVNGSDTANNLTPRITDLTGLSSFDTLERAAKPGDKAQSFVVASLAEGGLGAFREEPPEGHVVIRPLDPLGLSNWLASRASGTYADNKYTQYLREIAVEVRRPK